VVARFVDIGGIVDHLCLALAAISVDFYINLNKISLLIQQINYYCLNFTYTLIKLA
jgi:hypothetical protein